MVGRLVGINGELLASFPIGRPDKLTLRDLLHAAGVALDERSDYAGRQNTTFRMKGMVLNVYISYQNSESTWFGTTAPTYTYSVRRIPEMEYKVIRSIRNANNERIKHRMNGVNIRFIQSGKIARFSWSSLVGGITSAFGLMASLSLVIDLLALYVHPDKSHFYTAKYQEQNLIKDDKKKQ